MPLASIDVTRTLLLLLMTSLLSACQSGGTVPPAESTYSGITPEYVASLPAGQSRPAVDRLSNEVVAGESESCRENPDVDWEACVSTRMLLIFDRYGFLADHCGDRTGDKELRDCVAFGRSGVDWVLAMEGNPDTDFDWSKPEQSHDAALKKLNDVLTERCKGRPEEPGNSCFTSESARVLGLSATVAAQCAARQKLEERGACIVDAHDTVMYRAALAMLSR
ncbi:MAG TPA: hypothetical protein VFE34_20385 [Dongiaceae bacterium]|nr:hypothetical protein [Dongiaceae bacterium]